MIEHGRSEAPPKPEMNTAEKVRRNRWDQRLEEARKRRAEALKVRKSEAKGSQPQSKRPLDHVDHESGVGLADILIRSTESARKSVPSTDVRTSTKANVVLLRDPVPPRPSPPIQSKPAIVENEGRLTVPTAPREVPFSDVPAVLEFTQTPRDDNSIRRRPTEASGLFPILLAFAVGAAVVFFVYLSGLTTPIQTSQIQAAQDIESTGLLSRQDQLEFTRPFATPPIGREGNVFLRPAVSGEATIRGAAPLGASDPAALAPLQPHAFPEAGIAEAPSAMEAGLRLGHLAELSDIPSDFLPARFRHLSAAPQAQTAVSTLSSPNPAQLVENGPVQVSRLARPSIEVALPLPQIVTGPAPNAVGDLEIPLAAPPLVSMSVAASR